jgi:hypothetical protein
MSPPLYKQQMMEKDYHHGLERRVTGNYQAQLPLTWKSLREKEGTVVRCNVYGADGNKGVSGATSEKPTSQ